MTPESSAEESGLKKRTTASNESNKPECSLPGRQRIGLIAGWGRYPIVLAIELKRQGHQVVCLGVKQHADPVLRDICDDYGEAGIGRMGSIIRFFHRRGVTHATMAGKIQKVMLFQRCRWLKNLPDLTTLAAFYPHLISRARDCNDDSLLGKIVELFGRHGIILGPATNLVPELLVKHGLISKRELTAAERKDIEYGWRLAKEIGRLDIGQSVAVKGRAVIAVEAVEGTDECIRRAGTLCPSGGFTVVKVAKPQQDMRFDVPTIGLGTLQTLIEAGGRVLAVEAGKTILIDEPDVVAMANRCGITVVACYDGQIESMPAAA